MFFVLVTMGAGSFEMEWIVTTLALALGRMQLQIHEMLDATDEIRAEGTASAVPRSATFVRN
jgi:hypothetical protein